VARDGEPEDPRSRGDRHPDDVRLHVSNLAHIVIAATWTASQGPARWVKQLLIHISHRGVVVMATRDAAAGTLPGQPVMPRPAVSLPGRRRWLGAGAAGCVGARGPHQVTPLLLLYLTQPGLRVPVVDAMFGLYAIGLVPGLLVGGSLSDRIGRRRVVVLAVALSMVAGGMLIAGAHTAGRLFAGRLIMGLAAGGAFSAGAAWIKELSAPPHDDAPPGAGARRAGGAMTLGF